MASYTVTNTAGVLSATSGADSIYVQSAALQASTILGLGGNDTINLEEVLVNLSAAAPSIHGGAGNDSIYIASANFSAGGGISILGGAGGDTITVAGSGGLASVKAGDDADSLSYVGGKTAEFIGMGAGADTLVLSASVDTIGMGNGHDEISASTVTFLTAGFIKLGDGKDTIQAGELAGESAAVINGDSSTNGGIDLIDLDSTVTSLTVRGGVGADTITISGMKASAMIAGNGGHDSIGVVDLGTNASLKGGDGRDTITISALTTNALNVVGGNDADSIYLQNILAGDAASARIQGGAGADTIRISGTLAGAGHNLGTFVFSSLSESTLSSMDIVDAGTAITGVGTASAFFDFSNNASAAGTVSDAAAAITFGSTANKATVTQSVVTFSGTLNVSSVTAAAASVDKVVLGAGSVALFADSGGTEYLFMQGGSTGTSDDSIIRFEGLSATSIAAGGSAAVITFSGAD